MNFQLVLGVVVLSVPLMGQAAADGKESPSPQDIEFFEKNIRPVLANHCYGCHSSQTATPMGSLVLDSKAGVLRGGKSGPAVVPGKPDESLLIKAVKGVNKDFKMPPGKRLEEREIEALTAWVKMGAPDPRNESSPKPIVSQSSYDWDQVRKHWAFQPLEDSQPPKQPAPAWNKTPIDRFIKAKLAEEKLAPVGLASKTTLIRRATYDLTGLPPTPKDVEAFVQDQSPNAFEKVIDRLLASQQYGERWGRHWMDVVRYADTAGDNSDFPVPSMYRYRNYIIDSFNADKPYDQFLKEQLAGDLLPASDKKDWQQKVIATGYLANARRFGSQVKEFHFTLDDTIENLGKAILGLTVGCARCHDHKYDPIPITDYYALYGIFQSSKYAFPGVEVRPRAHSFVALGSPEDAKTLKHYETELGELERKRGSLRSAARRGGPDAAEKAKELMEVENALRRMTANYPDLPKAYAVMEGEPANARIMVRGDPNMLGAEVPRGFLTILGGQKVPEEEKRSGRLPLAEWITDPANPLTARVIVNRIWAWHFGRGIVASTDDFGSRGEKPSHPELLDYLVSRFLENGWSIKKMHKLMMLTRTYQMASEYDEGNATKDPNNAFLWRFNPRRLHAEEIRDTFLAVSGNLDYSRGGEHPFPPEMEFKFTQHRPFLAVYETNRRSVYLMQQRIRRHPFFELFDGPDPNSVMGVRPVTVTALQALHAMNDAFVHEQADELAIRVFMARANDVERVRYAYQLLFARTPAAGETKQARQYLAEARQSLQDVAIEEDRLNRDAWASLMRVLLSSNEFLILE